MQKCLFCQFATKKISTNIVFENDKIMVFHDINPVAPVHLLICPKKHIESINDIKEEEVAIVMQMIIQAKKLAKKFNIENSGFRLVINTGKSAGQEIKHLHIHLIGGKRLGSMA